MNPLDTIPPRHLWQEYPDITEWLTKCVQTFLVTPEGVIAGVQANIPTGYCTSLQQADYFSRISGVFQ